MAPQRLARGRHVARLDAFASLSPAQLRELLATDKDFRELVGAEREQLMLAARAIGSGIDIGFCFRMGGSGLTTLPTRNKPWAPRC